MRTFCVSIRTSCVQLSAGSRRRKWDIPILGPLASLCYGTAMPRTTRGSGGELCGHIMNLGNARAVEFHEVGEDQAHLELAVASCAPAAHEAGWDDCASTCRRTARVGWTGPNPGWRWWRSAAAVSVAPFGGEKWPATIAT